MNNENTEKLFNRFKFFYPQRPVTESLMGFGFECGDGWFDLIWDLSEKIEKQLKKREKEETISRQAKDKLLDKIDFQVVQVKEKFGTLRFYTQGGSKEIDDLINEAEEKSATTCEQCGKPGKSRNHGWIRVLCDECENKRRQTHG